MIWVLMASGLVSLAGLVGILLAGAVVTRHRAEAAADLAALAAADRAIYGPSAACARASLIAGAHGAALQRCGVIGSVADVTVTLPVQGPFRQLPPVSARARAGPPGASQPWRR